MIGVTGATGALGSLIVERLATKLATGRFMALVRDPQKAAEQFAAGTVIRYADYDRPETLQPALAGVNRLLLISSNNVGHRLAQHQAVIDAARHVGVQLIAYTSLLHADRSTLNIAEEHRLTEAAIVASGLPHIFLRNGWYTENYTATIPAALAHGVMLGSANGGRIASAARADFADAAIAALEKGASAGRVLELAGDDAYTLSDFAAELSAQAGRSIPYRDLPEAEYRAVLEGAGMPADFAALITQSDTAAANGALYDDSRTLSRLIGRPTTPLKTSIATALKA